MIDIDKYSLITLTINNIISLWLAKPVGTGMVGSHLTSSLPAPSLVPVINY
jgi:hypothetical protein